MKHILFLISVSYSSFAQTNTIDSLKKVLQTQTEDTNKVNSIISLSRALSYNGIDPSRALVYVKEALSLAQKINFKAGVAQSYSTLGICYYNEDNALESLKNLYASLKLNEEMGNKKQSAMCLFWIGIVYYYLQEDYQLSLNALSEALKKYRQIGSDDFYYAACYIYLANVYRKRKKYEEAFTNVSEGLKMSVANGYTQMIANGYSCVGDILSAEISVRKSTGNNAKEVITLKEARKNYLEAISNFKAAHDRGGLGDSYQSVSEINLRLHQFSEARKYADSALLTARQIKKKDNLWKSYLLQARLDSVQGNFKEAYKHYKSYTIYRDSIFTDEAKKKSLQISMQYEFDKKVDSTRMAQDKKDALAAAELKNQKLIRNFSLSGAIVILSFGGYSFYRYRRRRRLQSEQEMLNERLRISRELHDDMGSTLGSISIYSEVAKNRSAKNENADEVILKIGAASRELIDKMSDIVWSINPNNESLEQLQNRMQAFAAMILTPQHIQHSFLADESIKKLKLTAEERKNIFLIYKEAIHNIVKYADCKEVEIKLSLQDDQLEMIIKDDGKGFDTSSLSALHPASAGERENGLGGNGIKNMKARAEIMHADFKINSEINKGTKIELKFHT